MSNDPNTPADNPDFWKRKLAALLHDPPSKALDIPGHREHAAQLYRNVGFSEDEIELFTKEADWTASSADRFPFPASRPSGLQCAFDGVRNTFHHPLGPGEEKTEPLRMPFRGSFVTDIQAKEVDQLIQPHLDEFGDLTETENWRARFFAHWRLWQRHATHHDYRFGFFPADTRLPDHTVWTHVQVVAALQGCAAGAGSQVPLKPAFLKLQIGGVQDFIAHARSTRDLWSGSYLMSWLMATGLKALSAEIGPDAVIFPNLKEQPLFDLQWRDELWNKVRIGHGETAKSVWESFAYESSRQDALRTPSLPNTFLAVVPAERARELAETVKNRIHIEWKNIADACYTLCDDLGLTATESENEGSGLTAEQRRRRFDEQIARFPSVDWQVDPWPSTFAQAIDKISRQPRNEMVSTNSRQPHDEADSTLGRIHATKHAAESAIPVEHRDPRYYTDPKARNELNNIGLAWAGLADHTSWLLDGVRQTRCFSGWTHGGWNTGTAYNKDSLTGREESVAGGRTWAERVKKHPSIAYLFKHENDWIGGLTLVKRLWHTAYLAKEPWNLPVEPKDIRIPSTRGIANHDPDKDTSEEELEKVQDERYFAVLAFDGDEIGKWVRGDKAPRLRSQLASYTDGSGNPTGALPYFETTKSADTEDGLQKLLHTRRPVSPSYHLQFSEALGNFSLLCVEPIVRAYNGRLIYSGGDDVLALLPADTAIACARALRMAFRGEIGIGRYLRETVPSRGPGDPGFRVYHSAKQDHPGFLVRDGEQAIRDTQGELIPFLVPGPAAEVSAGIAVAHFKAPLQDTVKAAQAAENRAKRPSCKGGLDRGALAITLLKRSGETIEWGARWDEGGLDLYAELANALEHQVLSNRFPYRLVELLQPYLTARSPGGSTAGTAIPGFDVAAIVCREVAHTLEHQTKDKRAPSFESLRNKLLGANAGSPQPDALLPAYLNALSSTGADERIRSLIGLAQSVAFAHRLSNPQSRNTP